MRILFYDMGSFTYGDIKEALLRAGHSVETLYYALPDKYSHTFFEERLALELKNGSYDAIFSVNFFPVVAKIARENDTLYISWSYDSPLEEGFLDYFGFNTNKVFLFDRSEAEYYQKRGFQNVYHMPLAVNIDRINKLPKKSVTKSYTCDVAFMGSMYDSKLLDILSLTDAYISGYIEALMQVQLELYGTNIVDAALSEQFVNRFNKSMQASGQSTVSITKKGLSFAIDKHLTHLERTMLVNELCEHLSVNYYGFDSDFLSEKVRKCGPLKYLTDMNYAFYEAKVNLCPTLRSITSGIPLRALDIMAAGGLLLSNYQPELAEYFVDGESVLMYESLEDAIEKAMYYSRNFEAGKKIAGKGHEIVSSAFRYEDKINEILRISFS